MPHVRERLADAYRQLGHGVGRAARAGAGGRRAASRAGGRPSALPALRRIVGLHPDNVGSRVRLAETASQIGRGRRGGARAAAGGGAAEAAGAHGRVRAGQRAAAVPSPEGLRGRARAGRRLHRAQEPASGAGQAAGGAEGGAPRSAERRAPGRGAGAARPAQGDLGLARAGRDPRRRRAHRRARRGGAIGAGPRSRPTARPEELAANWNVPATPSPARCARRPAPHPRPPSLAGGGRARCRPQTSTASGVIDTGVVSGPVAQSACPG